MSAQIVAQETLIRLVFAEEEPGRALAEELADLYLLQDEWCMEQADLDEEADRRRAAGEYVRRTPWCWKHSPYAARIFEIEQAIEELGI